MEIPYLKVKIVRDGALMPSKREEDACYDLYGVFEEEAVFLYPGDIRLTALGIATEFPKNWFFRIFERSSAGSKGISARSGIIDSGYRGEYFTPLNNVSNRLIVISNLPEDKVREKYFEKIKGYEENLLVYPQNKAIAQGTLLYSPHIEIEQVDELDMATIRGAGALGSSGK